MASLRHGAFLLSYAPLEGFFNEVTEYRATKGRPLPVPVDRVRVALCERWGIPNATNRWGARTRVPSVPGSGGRSRWAVLTGHRLSLYLMDMKSLRDLLIHGSDPSRVTNKSGALWPLKKGGFSMRLMGVEGFIQAAQDIASCTALAIAGVDAEIPQRPTPPPSGVSEQGRLPDPY